MPGRWFMAVVMALLVAAGLVLAYMGGTTGRAGPDLAVPPASGGRPSPSPSEPPRAPQCRPGDVVTEHRRYGDWDRVLLDTRIRLPGSYAPPDLVPVSEAGFEGQGEVRRFVIDDLAALRKAALAAGYQIEILAAYRSFERQRDLIERRTGELERRALARTARPGHSEHQLGTAVDFKNRGASDVTVAWGRSPEGRWMARNAHRFGFVLSYPKGGRGATCYPYEPWHFRYLGRDVAAAVHSSGLTVREYLWSQRRG